MIRIILILFCYMALLASCKQRDNSEIKELPESLLIDMFNETSNYNKNLQAKFGSSGLNFTVEKQNLRLVPPIKDSINLLSRFGTPTIAKVNFLDDSDPIGVGYFHEALDIARKDPYSPDDVFAPVSGKARLVFDADPTAEDPAGIDSYSTSLVIHDESSNALVSILHLKPLPNFYQNEGFVDVSKGEVIGQIGKLERSVIQDKPEFRHVHLMIIDFEKRQFLNPSFYLSGYKDTEAPHLSEVALYDEQRKRHSKLTSGKLDIVVSAYDMDNFSTFNQEIARMALVVNDHHGNELFNLPDCDFNDFWFEKDLGLKSPLHAINIQPIFDPLPVESANIAREKIFFEYAATNFNVKGGQCEILADEDGYVSIDDSHQYVIVSVKITDHFGNQIDRKFEIKR